MKRQVKRTFRRPVFLALFLLLRPFGRVPVRMNGINAVFSFRSIDELIRAWGFTGEKAMFGGMLKHVRAGDTVWDVGANIGTHTVMFCKKVGNGGTVIAFEPESGTRETLKKNVAMNGLTNVHVLPLALGSDDGVRSMFVDNRPGSGKHSLISMDGFQEIEIEVRTGDSLGTDQLGGAPSVIKIDVEGFEIEVLKGLEQTLASERCKIVMCEVHTKLLRQDGHDPESVEQMLRSAGFTSFERTRRGDELHLLAIKQ